MEGWHNPCPQSSMVDLDSPWLNPSRARMKPAVPKYLEHTAFGVQAQRKHPDVFGDNNAASTNIAQMLPQRLLSRLPAIEPSGSGKYAGPFVEANEELRGYIANAPFPSGISAAYFEVEIEATAEAACASDIVVNIGIEKRNVGKQSAAVETQSYEPSSEEFDDTSDIEEEASSGSNANISLSASWSRSGSRPAPVEDDLLEHSEDEELFRYGATAVSSTLDKPAVWDWVWKLGSGMLVSTAGKRRSSSFDRQLSEPLKAAIACPLRIGFCLDLDANKVILTRAGLVLAAHSVEANYTKERPNALGDGLVLVPTVAVRNARVRPVFGDGNMANDGFLFDIAAYCRSQFSMPPMLDLAGSLSGPEHLKQLTLEYFAFYGYTQAVDAWMRRNADLKPPQTSLALRRQIREQIRLGDIERVHDLLEQAGVEKLSPELEFKLEFQGFVQLMRTSADINRVLDQGRRLFSKYNAEADGEVRAKLEQASGLLVSSDAQDSVHQALYGPEAIYELTTAVLSAVSEAEGLPSSPELNSLLAGACRYLTRAARRGDGTASVLVGELAKQMGWY